MHQSKKLCAKAMGLEYDPNKNPAQASGQCMGLKVGMHGKLQVGRAGVCKQGLAVPGMGPGTTRDGLRHSGRVPWHLQVAACNLGSPLGASWAALQMQDRFHPQLKHSHRGEGAGVKAPEGFPRCRWLRAPAGRRGRCGGASVET